MKLQRSKKILAIASGGGHWIQLLRLRPGFENLDVIYITVSKNYLNDISNEKAFIVNDANQWEKWQVLKLCFNMFRLVLKIRPNYVISTGAAPGFFGILFGKLFGAKTVWVDSIANVKEISLSGRLASRFCDHRFTQWKELDGKNGFVYKGAVI
ncbi:MAG: hypothetical protein JXR70_06490 [Spirochaetales bacterium]|nr:hypothetical protein [Spirochaetales bacterium]